MKERLIELLACPTCGGEIAIAEIFEKENAEIISAKLICENCHQDFPVIRGVPRFAELEKIEPDKAETARNFGWQWTRFTQDDERYADQFLGWLQPVKPDFFRGKIVLEGGCGKGRHTKLAAEWGAQEIDGGGWGGGG